jgi:hypothetical protein
MNQRTAVLVFAASLLGLGSALAATATPNSGDGQKPPEPQRFDNYFVQGTQVFIGRDWKWITKIQDVKAGVTCYTLGAPGEPLSCVKAIDADKAEVAPVDPNL